MKKQSALSSQHSAKVKARDIVDGWPRGGSSLVLWGYSRARAYVLYADFAFFPYWRNLIGDPQFQLDVAEELREEHRKAEMMRRFLSPPTSLLECWAHAAAATNLKANPLQEDLCQRLRLRAFS